MGVIVADRDEHKRLLARERGRRYRERHPDRWKDRDRRWREKHPEQHTGRQKRYRDKNQEKIRIANAAWRAQNPDYSAAWYQDNKDKAESRAAEWRSKNRDRWNLYSHERRNRLAESGTVSPGRPAELMRLQRGKCAVCRNDLTAGYHIDHIIPLALDGPHEDGNLQLLCPPCNCQKWCKDPIIFMQSRGFLL